MVDFGHTRALRIYFLGICGTAMGHAALLMRELGHEVLGADTDIYPPMSDLLRKAGVEILEGYDAKRLEAIAPDVVVVGNIASRGHPEVEWLLETRAIPYASLPALLAQTILQKRCNIVVSGTHGKTTTTAIAAHILESAGLRPGFLIGGVPVGKACGAQLGDAQTPFVIEGDEYDCAFFDKRSKFIHYQPRILVINNVEFDHADIFKDLEDIKRSFAHATRLVPQGGAILANGDDLTVEDIVKHVSWTNVWRVGVGAQCDLRIVDFQEGTQGSTFTLVLKQKHWGVVHSPLGGIFNARNVAMAALSAGLSLYPQAPQKLELGGIANFSGVLRRQQVLYADERHVYIEDFGHHPTAMEQTVHALKARYPDRRVLACFEPRSNTICSGIFQESLAQSLREADDVYIGPIHRAKKWSATHCLDTERMCVDLQNTGVRARAFASNAELLERLMQEHTQLRNEGTATLVCFFSNGSFDGVMSKFVDSCMQ